MVYVTLTLMLFSNLPLKPLYTRGHNKKLTKSICNKNWQLNFFLVELLQGRIKPMWGPKLEKMEERSPPAKTFLA